MSDKTAFSSDLMELLNNPLFIKMLNAFTTGISIISPEGTVLYFNDSECSIFGFNKQEDYIGKPLQKIFKTSKLGFWDAITSKKTNSHPTISHSGVEGLTFRTPVTNNNGDIVCCVVETITTTRETERLDGLLAAISVLKQKAEYYDKKASNQTSIGLTFETLIGASPAMQHLKMMGERFAKTSAAILIQGESGTGKELVAQALHMASNRAGKPFIAVNCAALPPSLAESELFGYCGGAFSGASNKGMKGKFELANHGTIFLDEVAELPLNIQAKLLRVLENKEVQKLGGSSPIHTDFRLIAATNKDLCSMVKEKTFREDLYHRLSILELNVPPLRERTEDIPLLIHTLLRQCAGEQRARTLHISEDVITLFKNYLWPGNVRELKNILTSTLCCLAPEETTIGSHHLPVRFLQESISYGQAVEKKDQVQLATLREYTERQGIIQALKKHHNNKQQAAAELGISRNTLYKKMKKLQIDLDLAKSEES